MGRCREAWVPPSSTHTTQDLEHYVPYILTTIRCTPHNTYTIVDLGMDAPAVRSYHTSDLSADHLNSPMLRMRPGMGVPLGRGEPPKPQAANNKDN